MFEIFDLSNNRLVKIAVIFFGIFLAFNIIYLLILSFINRDFTVPIHHPFMFALETLLIGFGCGLIILLIRYNRSGINKYAILDYIILSLRLSGISLLMQFSGVYSYLFT